MLQPMRFASLALAVLVLPSIALVPACKRREEPLPPPPPPAAPVSIWGAADSQAVATQLVEAAARDPWTSQFRDRNGRAATVAVGEISDRSGHTIPLAGLTEAISAALTKSGGDKLAAGGAGSDFVIGGVIGASAGSTADGTATMFFAIDLSLAERASGEKAWLFAVERGITVR
jgi:hypothetical protein